MFVTIAHTIPLDAAFSARGHVPHDVDEVRPETDVSTLQRPLIPATYGPRDRRALLAPTAHRVQEHLINLGAPFVEVVPCQMPFEAQFISLVFRRGAAGCHVFTASKTERDRLRELARLSGLRVFSVRVKGALFASKTFRIGGFDDTNGKSSQLIIHTAPPSELCTYMADLRSTAPFVLGCHALVMSRSDATVNADMRSYLEPSTCRHVLLLLSTGRRLEVPETKEFNCYRCDVCLREPRAFYGDAVE